MIISYIGRIPLKGRGGGLLKGIPPLPGGPGLVTAGSPVPGAPVDPQGQTNQQDTENKFV